jgi:homoserine/homoserine lactone efflux protein
LFLHGFLAHATKPKAWLSLVAIAPGFIDPAGSLPTQAVVMGVVMVGIDLAVMSGYTAVGAWCFRSCGDRPGLQSVPVRRLFALLYGVAAGALALAT